MKSKLYYDPYRPSAFSTLEKLQAAFGKDKKKESLRVWLEKQDAYTLHRQVRKRFPRNLYSVTNVMDVWECDLVDVSSLGKYNDKYNYILTVIDVFSKYLHMVPLKVKTGAATASAFESVLRDPRYLKRPLSGFEQTRAKSFWLVNFRRC